MQLKKNLLKFFLVFIIFFYIFLKNFKNKKIILTENISKQCNLIKNPKRNSLSSNNEKCFLILDVSTNNILKVPVKEFLVSTVALEMEASAPIEALKAQAIASNTFFRNLKEKNNSKKIKELKGADLFVNTEKNIYFLTKNQLKEKWKENYQNNYTKIHSIVSEVFNKVLKFNGKVIEALYHDISSGKTENNEEVFGNYCQYLVSVDSSWDKNEEGYLSIKKINLYNFQKTISNEYKKYDFCDLKKIRNFRINTAKTGFVKNVYFGEKSFTGREIRELFGLRSANFDLEITKKYAIFTVRGHGHGVGMSQSGAITMAKNGENFDKILSHYYPKTQICEY